MHCMAVVHFKVKQSCVTRWLRQSSDIVLPRLMYFNIKLLLHAPRRIYFNLQSWRKGIVYVVFRRCKAVFDKNVVLLSTYKLLGNPNF